MGLGNIERLASQSFLGSDSHRILADIRVAIIGLSGGGSHVALQLSHVGVGNFVLFDFDRVVHRNLNRMVGASEKDAEVGALKASVLKRVINSVNASANVTAVSSRWQEGAEFLRDADTIFSCVDSFSEREQIEAFARRYLIPVIDVGMDVHRMAEGFTIGGQLALSMPGGLCLRCYGIITDDRLALEAAAYGDAGSRPQVVWANGVLASAAVGSFVQLFCPWSDVSLCGLLREYDGESQTLSTSRKLQYLTNTSCPHFRECDVGDPFFASSAGR
jgi:molybdopterin-synthase adenylyltransferase